MKEESQRSLSFHSQNDAVTIFTTIAIIYGCEDACATASRKIKRYLERKPIDPRSGAAIGIACFKLVLMRSYQKVECHFIVCHALTRIYLNCGRLQRPSLEVERSQSLGCKAQRARLRPEGPVASCSGPAGTRRGSLRIGPGPGDRSQSPSKLGIRDLVKKCCLRGIRWIVFSRILRGRLPQ